MLEKWKRFHINNPSKIDFVWSRGQITSQPWRRLNCYLWEKSLPKHNQMFFRPAKESGSAYGALPKGLSLRDDLCLKEERTVAGDETIS